MCASPRRRRCRSISRASAASTTSSMKPAGGDFAMSRSSTTIWAAPRAEPWRARASRSSLPGCALARSALCFASTPPVSPVTDGTGIICSSCAVSSMPASSISMASTIPVVRMIGCCSGMKGSISEFELGVLRSRMLDAARSKARTRRTQDSRADRLHLASGDRPRPRSG